MSNLQSCFQPFKLSDDADYLQWRTAKLADYEHAITAPIVPIHNVARLSATEREAITVRCRKTNMAIYEVAERASIDKETIRAFGSQFGLQRLDMNLRADEDSITALRVMPETIGTHYIPYTNRPLNWHTDGYYNQMDEQVRGIVMHCASASATGGENRMLDPEIAYLLLRDENPDYVAALMQPDVMVIPANIENGVELRPAQSGPVFSVHQETGTLHMRYTARSRSIEWKDDRNTRLAAGFLTELLAGDSIYIIRHRFRAGQGIICNNVIHRREAFTDDAAAGKERLLYRARYYDRMRGTDLLAMMEPDDALVK